MQIPAFQLSQPINWHKSRLSHYCDLFLALSLEGFSAKRSTPLQSGKSRLFLQNTRGGCLPDSALGESAFISFSHFVAPLFSWSYKLLFPQAFCFDNSLRCRPGVPPLHAPNFISDHSQTDPAHPRSHPQAEI